jgi:hypothetical protein
VRVSASDVAAEIMRMPGAPLTREVERRDQEQHEAELRQRGKELAAAG